jgi:hypothetical protein
LDLTQYDELFGAIQAETGAPTPESSDLTITANVHTTADGDFGAVDDVFTHSIKLPLRGGSIAWDKNLTQSKSGAIEVKRIALDRDGYLAIFGTTGLSLAQVRVLAPIAAGVFLVAALYLLFLNLWGRLAAPPKPKIEREALRVKKKYGDFIVDIEELPDVKAGGTVIPVSSFDGLVKLIDEIRKPILHKADEKKHIYCVFDGSIRYEYVLEQDAADAAGEVPTSV